MQSYTSVFSWINSWCINKQQLICIHLNILMHIWRVLYFNLENLIWIDLDLKIQTDPQIQKKSNINNQQEYI